MITLRLLGGMATACLVVAATTVPSSAASVVPPNMTSAVPVGTAPPDEHVHTNRAAPTSEWTWPVGLGPPDVVREFDPPAERWSAGHRGVDLATSDGATVRAAGAGSVTYAGWIAGTGVVTVTHGELRTTYQPIAASVSIGDQVEAGQPIGTVTSTGSHCPPDTCLHWGLLRGETYLDPLSLVDRAGHARLLPLGRQALEPATPLSRAGMRLTIGPSQPLH